MPDALRPESLHNEPRHRAGRPVNHSNLGYVPRIEQRRRAFGRRNRLHVPLASPGLNALLIGGMAIMAALVAAGSDFASRYPLAKTLTLDADREMILLTANGTPFARRGGCAAAPVSLKEVPKHLIDALLAMEDRRFYHHFGIDPWGVVRAALANRSAGRIVQGGSTITQQLAKISYLSGQKTYDRKFEEALVALRLEMGLSKDEILERYLSRAYFGDGCYGLRAAARRYFDKRVSALTLAESAYLVGLLRSPTRLSGHRDAAKERAKLVLHAMVDDGRLDPAMLQQLPPAKVQAESPSAFGAYYADWAAKTVKQSEDGDLTPLLVRTSFDPKLQRIAEAAIRSIMRKEGLRRNANQAALVAMRPDGRVLAMVGGLDYRKSQFNRAAQALRQPGSSFKTFVYLAALRAGAHPDMPVVDAPISIGDWSPENYGRNYVGVVSLRHAFLASINTPAVRLSEAVGREAVIAAARDLGITTPLTPTPSLALGASEVTLLEMTSAFAAIAADAYPVKPWGVLSLSARPAGPVRPPQESGRWRLMVGNEMRDLLFSVVSRGTGRAAQLPMAVFAKTGTSQDYRDGWFIGFAGNLVVGVWVGNDDNSPMGRVTGGSLPARIWRAFMNEARKADARFTPQLQRVAAFKAQVKHGAMAALDGRRFDMLLAEDNETAAYYGWPGYPSMFGPAPDEWRNQQRARTSYRRSERPRGVRSWVTDMDGGG